MALSRGEATPGHGITLWLTGLPAAGKSTLARAIEREIRGLGGQVTVIDGDQLRATTSRDLGFSAADRSEQARRAAALAVDAGLAGAWAVVALVSPYAADRAAARDVHAANGLAFVEIWVATPLEVCEERDPKGLYTRARDGRLAGLTGVDAPYEPPPAPELMVSGLVSPELEARALVRRLLVTSARAAPPSPPSPAPPPARSSRRAR